MGALRVNKTDGTSSFLDVSGYSQVDIKESNFKRTIISGIKISDGSEEEWAVTRFETSPVCIWEEQMKVAYNAIKEAPIKYGYPNLGTDVKDYVKYDASKFGISALQQALTNQQEDEIPYTERTAICTRVIDQTNADAIVNDIENLASEAADAAAAIKNECQAAVQAGNTYTWPNGTVCDSEACCELQEGILKASIISSGLDSLVGDIEWKHQYLWLNLSPFSPS